MTKLLACPFCGEEDANVVFKYGFHRFNRFCVKCYCCEAMGPDCPTRDRAINAWNKRPTGYCALCGDNGYIVTANKMPGEKYIREVCPKCSQTT